METREQLYVLGPDGGGAANQHLQRTPQSCCWWPPQRARLRAQAVAPRTPLVREEDASVLASVSAARVKPLFHPARREGATRYADEMLMRPKVKQEAAPQDEGVRQLLLLLHSSVHLPPSHIPTRESTTSFHFQESQVLEIQGFLLSRAVTWSGRSLVSNTSSRSPRRPSGSRQQPPNASRVE